MAQNVREKFNSSIGVSTTGIAGPDGGSKAKPVKTRAALAKNETIVKEIRKK